MRSATAIWRRVARGLIGLEIAIGAWPSRADKRTTAWPTSKRPTAGGTSTRGGALNSTYTHCVVIHIRGHAAHDGLNAREPYSRAEWAGSLARAQKNARGWSGKSYIESVDVLEARVIPD